MTLAQWFLIMFFLGVSLPPTYVGWRAMLSERARHFSKWQREAGISGLLGAGTLGIAANLFF